MKVQCEQCKQELECEFYGRPSDVEKEKAQDGEWLCRECVVLREKELDDAIALLRRQLT